MTDKHIGATSNDKPRIPSRLECFNDYAHYFPDWEKDPKAFCVFRDAGLFRQRITLTAIPKTKEYQIIMTVEWKLGQSVPAITQLLQVIRKAKFTLRNLDMLLPYKYDRSIRFVVHKDDLVRREVENMRIQFRPKITEPLTLKAILSQLRHMQRIMGLYLFPSKAAKVALLAYEGKIWRAKKLARKTIKDEKEDFKQNGYHLQPEYASILQILMELERSLHKGTHMEYMNNRIQHASSRKNGSWINTVYENIDTTRDD